MNDYGLNRCHVQHYSPGVLVGNWYEDMTLREDELRLHKGRQIAASQNPGKTSTNVVAQSMMCARLDEPTVLSGSVGDVIRLGVPFAIMNEKTSAVLAVDMSAMLAPGHQQYYLAASPNTAPRVRSTWVVQRSRDEHNIAFNKNRPDILHYGQRIRIANEGASPDGFLYVTSALASGLHSTERQFVSASLNACADNVFVVSRSVTNRQDVHFGTPVKIGDPIVLLHSITNTPLACHGEKRSTSYGSEYELTCGYSTTYHSRSLGAVATSPENIFRFAVEGVEEAPRIQSRSVRPSVASFSTNTNSILEELIERIRSGALEVGGRIGFRSFAISLGVACNEHRITSMDRNGLSAAIGRLGIQLAPVELDALMKRFDSTGNNTIVVQEFLDELRGNMNAVRAKAVVHTFQQLVIEGEGSVVFSDMHCLYRANAMHHPSVLDHLISPEEVVFDFESCWPGRIGCKIGTVTLNEFFEYYNDISAAVESDERFIAILKNCWAIPATSSYLSGKPQRVIQVVHGDDTATSVPVPDSLLLDTNDGSAVRRLLIQHGLRNVKDFSISRTM